MSTTSSPRRQTPEHPARWQGQLLPDRLRPVEAADSTGGTRTEVGMGSCLYAAPEQMADAEQTTNHGCMESRPSMHPGQSMAFAATLLLVCRRPERGFCALIVVCCIFFLLNWADANDLRDRCRAQCRFRPHTLHSPRCRPPYPTCGCRHPDVSRNREM